MRAILIAILMAGCTDAASGPELLDGFDPTPPAADEIQIVSPIVRDIAPGADTTLCSYLPLDQAIPTTQDVVGITGFETKVASHHAILYLANRTRPVGTHECTEDDMVNVTFIGGVGGGESGGGTMQTLPAGIAYRLEGGVQLMIQTHWINTTEAAVDGQAAFNLKVQAPQDSTELANLFTWVDTNISVPAGQTGTTHTECVVQQDMSFYQIIGHAHEHGTEVKLTYTPAGGAPNVFYDQAWEKYMTFDPPRIKLDRDTAMQVHPGDTLSVDCSYANGTTKTLSFPTEMCVGIAFYFPGTKQINCVDGAWDQ